MRHVLLGLTLACASYLGVLVYANATKPEDLAGVVYVANYDGDTLTVDLLEPPNLPRIFQRMDVRLRGIDAPEIKGQCERERKLAQQAKQALAEQLRQAQQLILADVKPDKYFRLDATVLADGRNLNTYMLDRGLARPYTGGKREGWCGE